MGILSPKQVRIIDLLARQEREPHITDEFIRDLLDVTQNSITWVRYRVGFLTSKTFKIDKPKELTQQEIFEQRLETLEQYLRTTNDDEIDAEKASELLNVSKTTTYKLFRKARRLHLMKKSREVVNENGGNKWYWKFIPKEEDNETNAL